MAKRSPLSHDSLTARRRGPKPSIRVRDGRTQPFSWFPNEIIRDYGAQMGPHAGWVYMCLVVHANKDGVCYPSQATIAQMTGVSLAEVKRSLRKLVQLGLIAVTMRRPKPSVFTILDLPERQENRSGGAIEQLTQSYEVDVVEVDPPNKNQRTTSSPTPPSPTPSAPDPIPTDEEVEEEQRRFQQFWEAYPRHIDKPLARRAFGNAHIDDATLAAILAALQVQIPQWRRQGMRVGIKPADYLENEMWLDVLDVKPEAARGCRRG
jgi:hypothetical protein